MPLNPAATIEKKLKKHIQQDTHTRESTLCARDLHFNDSEIYPLTTYLTQHPEIVNGDFSFGCRSHDLIAELISINTFKKLEFYDGPPFSNKGNAGSAVSLAKAIFETDRLVELSLPYLPPDWIRLITSSVRDNPSLQSISLYIDENPESQKAAANVIAHNIIHDNPRIKTFCLHAERLSDEAVTILMEALAENKTLEEFRLYGLSKLSDALSQTIVDCTNRRKKPIKLAMHYSIAITPTAEAIFLGSHYISSFTDNVIATNAMRACFDANLARQVPSASHLTSNSIFTTNTQKPHVAPTRKPASERLKK